MRRVRINAVHVAHAVADFTDKLWLVVTLDNNEQVCLEKIEMGKGAVIWDDWYNFSLFKYDDNHVRLCWEDNDDDENKSTLDILNRRLVVGEKIVYCDDNDRFVYIIDTIIELP